MNAIKGFLAVGSVAFCGLALGGLVVGTSGCAEPGVVQVNPTGVNVNKKDAGTTKKDAGKPPVQQDEDEATADQSEDEDKPAGEDDEDVGSEDKQTPPTASKDAGKSNLDAGGSKADAGVTKPGTDAGKETVGTGEVAACPSGYMCQDPAGPLSEMGLEGEITFQDGTPVEASCAKGGMETCDLKDPKKSCPNFTNPVCIHVKITGLLAIDFQQCGQKCEP
jgi:hypothetical protein